ncbi:hypothetical protein ACBJ59_10760 [Nonomuraea sp. MTCD27]|uniref:hypothetical protein n=1 Tax=Nonomuraea sp. MTCD27 TaxID=1676747 RepID=UPI0035BFF30F
MIESDEGTRRVVAKHLAERQGVSMAEAMAKVDDVCLREKESPHLREVVEAVGAALRPVIDMISAVKASGDPYSEESVAAVMVVGGDVLYVGEDPPNN